LWSGRKQRGTRQTKQPYLTVYLIARVGTRDGDVANVLRKGWGEVVVIRTKEGARLKIPRDVVGVVEKSRRRPTCTSSRLVRGLSAGGGMSPMKRRMDTHVLIIRCGLWIVNGEGRREGRGRDGEAMRR
jgi:hypothetical protein